MQPQASAPLARRRILLFEHTTAGQELTRWLEMAGFEIALCEDADELPHALWRFRPEVLILDTDVPGVPVRRIAEVARRFSENGPPIGIFFYTDLPLTDFHALTQAARSHGYALKSDGPDELARRIHFMTRPPRN